MKTFDIILVTDTATYPSWSRGYGAHRLANHLRSNGYSTLVIDFCSALTFEIWQQLIDLTVGENTKIVGFSSTWWPYRKPGDKNYYKTNPIEFLSNIGESPNIAKDSLTFAAISGNMKPWTDLIKNKNKKIKILLGGPKIDWYFDFPADHFVNGLGENQIIDMLTETKRIWPKVVSHDATSNARDWGWPTSMTIYTKYDQMQSKEILNLEIARGCKFKCSFCSFPLIGQKETAKYTKTEETIYTELMHNYENWGITKYFIADDTYNDSTEKLEMMLRIKNKLPFDFKVKAYVRADLMVVQPRQLDLLLKGGLASCYIGLESFHPKASKFAGKAMDPKKRKQVLYDMQSAWGDDVSINVGYIVGLPGEDEQFLRKQALWFAEENCPVNYGVSFIPLMINPVRSGSYAFPSEIDKNPGAFGYTISDMENNNAGYWTKDDGTDINDYHTAARVAMELNYQVWSARKPKEDNIDYKKGELADPVNDYFLPLLELLRNG